MNANDLILFFIHININVLSSSKVSRFDEFNCCICVDTSYDTYISKQHVTIVFTIHVFCVMIVVVCNMR